MISNPSETNPYPQESETNPYLQEPCQHVTEKEKFRQFTTVILQLDLTYYKIMNKLININITT